MTASIESPPQAEPPAERSNGNSSSSTPVVVHQDDDVVYDDQVRFSRSVPPGSAPSSFDEKKDDGLESKNTNNVHNTTMTTTTTSQDNYDDDDDDDDGSEDEEYVLKENPDAVLLQEILKDKRANDSPFYHKWMKHQIFCGAVRAYPRVFSLLCAVFLPTTLLVILSLVLGLWLAKLESPMEIASNDANLALAFQARRSALIVPELASKIPPLCTHSFLEGVQPTSDEILLHFDNETLFLERVAETIGDNRTRTTPINPRDMFDYMTTCGNAIKNRTQRFLDQAIDDALDTSLSLSFNWIRCFPGAGRLEASLVTRDIMLSQVTPDAQTATYTRAWVESQQQLQTQLLQEFSTNNDNPNMDEIRDRAFTEAVERASGGGTCEVNDAGSAWFWFTVMTTIGYGNQAPVTTGGRALIFTFGFLSILAFAKILASAGFIVAFLFDDVVQQHPQLSILKRPDVGCLFWATLCYGWIGIFAAVTRAWREERLDEEFSFAESYWYAFITTTTVGLGDFFLEPEIILNRDLWYFPILVLMGFTFLAAFLTKFSEFFQEQFDTTDRRGFVESLLKDLQHFQALRVVYPEKTPAELRAFLNDMEFLEEENLRKSVFPGGRRPAEKKRRY